VIHRFKSAALILVLVLSSSVVYAEMKMSLEECLKKAIENNPSLAASRFEVEASQKDVKAARADFLPSITSGYSFNRLMSESAKGPTETDYLDQDIRSFNLGMTQILYAGSRIINTYRKAKAMEMVAAAEMALGKLELVYNVETTFYKLMKAKQDVIIATDAVQRLKESIKSAEAFLKKQLVPYVEVLQARVDLADARERLATAKNDVNRERVILFSLMDMPSDPYLEFEREEYKFKKEEFSFDDSIKHAFENRPDIKSLEYQMEVVKKEKKIALGKYLPVLKVDVGYYDQDRDYEKQGVSLGSSFDRDQRNRYWSASIGANWNIFDGGKAWYGSQRYGTEVKKIKALIKEAQNMISTGIRNANFAMTEAEQRISTSVDALVAAEEYYAREEHRLKAGVSTIPSLLDSQGRLIRAQGNLTRAVLDFQLAKSELELMMGLEKFEEG